MIKSLKSTFLYIKKALWASINISSLWYYLSKRTAYVSFSQYTHKNISAPFDVMIINYVYSTRGFCIIYASCLFGESKLRVNLGGKWLSFRLSATSIDPVHDILF